MISLRHRRATGVAEGPCPCGHRGGSKRLRVAAPSAFYVLVRKSRPGRDGAGTTLHCCCRWRRTTASSLAGKCTNACSLSRLRCGYLGAWLKPFCSFANLVCFAMIIARCQRHLHLTCWSVVCLLVCLQSRRGGASSKQQQQQQPWLATRRLKRAATRRHLATHPLLVIRHRQMRRRRATQQARPKVQPPTPRLDVCRRRFPLLLVQQQRWMHDR